MEIIEIKDTRKQIDASKAILEDSKFTMVYLNRLQMNDVAVIDAKITNANLSNLEIEDAQLGGAYFHNIGIPPEGHPYYDPNAKQRPLRFENCDLQGSGITNCNLSKVSINDCNLSKVNISDCNLSSLDLNDCNLADVSISDCNTKGMKINGILVDDLLKAYQGL